MMKQQKLLLYSAKGCGYCNNSGYIGRVGVYEIMEITKTHKEAIMNGNNSNELEDISIKNGMTTLAEECKKLVADGITTMTELANITLLKDYWEGGGYG